MMSEQKFEQTEWEVVEGVGEQAPPRASRAAMMRALLGPSAELLVLSLLLLPSAR